MQSVLKKKWGISYFAVGYLLWVCLSILLLTKMNPSWWLDPVCILFTGGAWWFGGLIGAVGGYIVCEVMEDANISIKCSNRCYQHCNGDALCPPEFEEPNIFVD